MKKIIITSIAVLALAASCIEDSRNNFMVDDTLSLVFDEQVVPVSVHAGKATVSVLKAGKGSRSADVTLGVSASALSDFNAENGTAYSQIGTSEYSFTASSVSFKPEEMTKTVGIEWNPASLISSLDGANSVIPVVIEEGSISVNEKRNLVLLNVLNSTVRLASSGSTVLAPESASENLTVSVKLAVDFPLPEDLQITLAVDNSLIAAYNAEKGESADAAPDGYAVLPTEGVTIPAGGSDCFATLTLNNSALFSGSKMISFDTILVPIKISATSVSGLQISDSAYYLLVRSPFGGPSVSRVWGLYSTAGHLWTEAYGLPAGADRNLTLDADWVYLPYAVGGSEARITAISTSDPDNKKLVNCSGFVTNTITTACVRVIDKGDGTTMLTASGASDNSFNFYAWPSGIDSAPTVYNLQCTWRRAGDRYEVHGTWADGMLYAHAYQGTFSTRYEIKNGAFTKTDRTLVNVPFTGFGSLYKHPDSGQMLFASSDTSAFMTPTGTTYKAGDGQDIHDMTIESFSTARLTYGYRPFTLKGEKYIAFTALDRNDGEDGSTTMKRARLVIVRDKGGFKASLDPDNMDIFFEAPLQGETFESLAPEQPTVNVGDCAVFLSGGSVLIAAGYQGIGVSLFKME